MEVVVKPALTPSAPSNNASKKKSDEASYILFQGESGPDHDEQLCVKGKRVTWLSGGRVQKSYTLDSNVIQACWCRFADFQDFPNRRFLCVLQRDMITVYGPDGDVFTVSLPCKLRCMWPLLEGLLLERHELFEMSPQPDTPTLFSLMHPLEELKPLSIFIPNSTGTDDPKVDLAAELAAADAEMDADRASGSSEKQHQVFFPAKNAASRAGEFVCDPTWRVVWTSETLPFIMTHSGRNNTHTLWVLRQSRHEIAKRLRSSMVEDQNYQTQAQAPLRSSVVMPTTPRETSTEKSPMELRISLVDGMTFDPAEEMSEKYDDEDINTEILIESAWTQQQPVPSCSSVFLACDLDHRPLLCMFTESRNLLEAFQIIAGGSDVRLEPCFQLEALSVVPVHSLWNCSVETARPYNYDLVVLERSGEMFLYTAHQRICKLSLASPQSSIDQAEEDSVVLGLHDPVSNRFTVTLADGTARRLTLRTSAKCPLVKACLQAFSCSLPSKLVHCIRMDLIEALRTRKSMVKSQDMLVSEWEVFSELMTGLLDDSVVDSQNDKKSPAESIAEASRKLNKGGQTSRKAPRKGSAKKLPKTMDVDADPDSAWLKLLASPHHSLFTNEQELRVLKRPLPDVSGVVSALNSGLERLQLTTKTDVGRFVGHLSTVLHALHLVYEDLKLNVLSNKRIKPFSSLLCKIAVRLRWVDYVDHYLRDFAHLVNEVPPDFFKMVIEDRGKKELPDEHPAQIHTWLLQCVRGTKETAVPYPLSVFMRHNLDAPCARSRKICHFYDVLTQNHDEGHQHLDKSQYSIAGYTGGLGFSSPLNRSRNMEGRLQSPFSPESPFSPQSPIFESPSLLHSCLYGTANRSRGPSLSHLAMNATADRSTLQPPKEEFPLFSPVSVAVTPIMWPASSPCERLVLAMVEEGFRLEDIESIPYGVALPLREAMRSCRQNPPGNWPQEAYVLIGREDLAKMLMTSPTPSDGGEGDYSKSNTVSETVNLDRQVDVAIGGNHQNSTTAITDPKTAAADHFNDKEAAEEDGTALIARQANLRFGRDRRLKEVQRILRSNRRSCISIPKDRLAELEEGGLEMKAENQAKLLQHVYRVLSLPIGRGMYTMASISPVLTEALVIPDLCLEGRVPPKNGRVELEPGTLADTATEWPAFHNGVATGLRVSPGQSQITRTWIVYNRPEQLNFSHAGFLMALGLQGHLSALAPSDFYWYLSQNHEATTVGVLLGMAATKRGTMDTTVSKMLCLHIPALLPPGFGDLEIPSIVQTAALIGIGLLYQGTAHRLMTEVLLSEIGRKPFSDKCHDREAYSLAAGLAFGLVTLGRGSDAVGLSDLQIENRLSQYMVGGRDNNSSSSKHKKNDNNANRCSTIKEGVMVNVDVTAPGSTLALGLMFMKSNNGAVASRLSIPDTHFLLDYVRPDFVLLRVVSRSLIMWDSVEPTEEWVESLIPKIVGDNVEALVQSKATEAKKSSAEEKMEEVFPEKLEKSESNVKEQTQDVDYQAIRQAYCNIVAGACLAIGLRYAGSARPDVQKLLSQLLWKFRALRTRKMSAAGVIGGHRALHKVDTPTLESCLGVAALGLALVMAGTGHLDTFRLLRSLRGQVDKTIQPGHQMALHMAIGLLFLGGGRYSLRTDPPAIAALVCAIFPRFPVTIDDNRYHLQALRHFYVLAVEARCIQTIDVDSNSACYVPLHIVIREGKEHASSEIDFVAPCLLPRFDLISSIEVRSPRFWPLKLDLEANPVHRAMLRNRRVLYVKRKTGYLLYEHDPKGLRSILSRSFPTSSRLKFKNLEFGESEKNKSELVSSFSADHNILAFADHFCNEKSLLGTFCTDVLYECLTREKPEMLRTYLAIYQIITHLHQQENPIGICNLKLVSAYYSGTFCDRLSADWTSEPLLQQEFVQSIQLAVKHFFEHLQFDKDLAGYAGHSLTRQTKKPDLPSVSQPGNMSQSAYLDPAAPSSRSALINQAVERTTSLATNSNRSRLYGCYLNFYEVPAPLCVDRGLVAARGLTKLLNMSIDPLPVVALHFPGLPHDALQKICRMFAEQ